jgi:hypothetical protein
MHAERRDGGGRSLHALHRHSPAAACTCPPVATQCMVRSNHQKWMTLFFQFSSLTRTHSLMIYSLPRDHCIIFGHIHFSTDEWWEECVASLSRRSEEREAKRHAWLRLLIAAAACSSCLASKLQVPMVCALCRAPALGETKRGTDHTRHACTRCTRTSLKRLALYCIWMYTTPLSAT